jgi:hypothetical protein
VQIQNVRTRKEEKWQQNERIHGAGEERILLAVKRQSGIFHPQDWYSIRVENGVPQNAILHVVMQNVVTT